MIDNNTMITHFRYCFIVLSLIFLAATSCSDSNLEQQGWDNNALLPFGDVDLHPLGETVTMPFTCSDVWKAKATEAWVSIKPNNGNPGTTYISISVPPNLGEDRETEIHIGGETLKVTQNQAVLSVDETEFDDVSEQAFEVGWQKARRELKVKSNIRWAFKIGNGTDSWIHIAGLSAGDEYGKDKVVLPKSLPLDFIENNIGDSQYYTTLEIVPVGLDGNNKPVKSVVIDALKKTIEITQDNLYFTIDEEELAGFDCLGKDYIDTQDEFFQDAHDNHTQNLTVTSEADWEIDTEADETTWGISCDPISSPDLPESLFGKQLKRITYAVSVRKANPDMINDRETVLNITVNPANGDPVIKEVPIAQDKYKFNIYVDDLQVDTTVFDNVGEVAKTVRIETDGPWNLNYVGDWMEDIDVLEGYGNSSLEIKAKGRNLNFQDNELRLTFRSRLNEQIQKPLQCKQDKFVFDAVFDPGESNQQEGNLLSLTRLDDTEHIMNIASSGPWSMTVSDADDDWLNVSNLIGDGNSDVKVKAIGANPSDKDSRTKTITLISALHEDAGIIKDGESRKIFTVRQDEYKFNILNAKGGSQFTPSSFVSYTSGNNIQTFVVDCGAPWKVTDCPTWITVSPTEGDGKRTATVTIKASDNTGTDWGKPRDGTIVIKSDRLLDNTYGDSKSLDVNQEKFVFDVSTDCTSNDRLKAYYSQNYKKTVSIKTLENVQWYLVKDNWILTDQVTGTGSGEFKVYSANYYTSAVRSGQVSIHCSPLNKNFPVTIYQEAYVFDMPDKTFDEFDELKPSAQYIDFECSGDWTVHSKPIWLVVKKDGKELEGNSGGIGNASLEVSANVNPGDRRSGSLIITSPGGHSKSYNVSQRDYQWEFESLNDNELTNISEMRGIDKTYEVKCSGGWTVESTDENVAKVTPVNSSGGRDKSGSIRIEVGPNYTTEDVTAYVKIKSVDFPIREPKEVLISQNAYRWSVTDTLNTYELKASGNGFISIKVECSGNWRVAASSWIKISTTEGTGDGKVVLTPEDNPNKSSREGTVTITSKENANLTKEIKFTQKGK